MIEYLTFDEVLILHDELVRKYGGLPGIRDRNLLYSALDAPKAAMFGLEMYPSIYDKAAAYLYHIVRNHPFNDANKRTGYTVVLVFLTMNNIPQTFKKEELENLTIEVAKGNFEKAEISHFLEHGAMPRLPLEEKSIYNINN